MERKMSELPSKLVHFDNLLFQFNINEYVPHALLVSKRALLSPLTSE